ncbi:hypothetical protein SAMN00768000_3683 [Sulfobacillus thermosulfidooxidans DSM 9293]|uniref:Uncharacterized protein n=1 Tax=Sulfobacillus thermosulfidooxidans (strain DSM 9293 / VKM B-1269 / AT-1) TaxID=929705 RepID=A0A1W1WPI9_SULTA|nr:hypothetical protein [Sulfobacillus thermosulfidooxidans]SMC08146.1 hypothetical protein SAMN00768000_3683 [Sulfobacillus thermosulfidooxidans DSM 9293]
MSTNGFVGIGTPTQWTACYNHSDSYPTGLGREVWQNLQDFRTRDHTLDRFVETLLHATDWRDVRTQGVCPYCGHVRPYPHTLGGVLALWDYQQRLTEPETFSAEITAALNTLALNQILTGYPDPYGHYHQHDPERSDDDDAAITPDTCDWLFMEWGYLIDPTQNLFHVFVGCIRTPLTYTVDIYRPNGSREIWADKPRYTGVLAGSYDITGPEPIWPLVDRMGRTLRTQLAAEFAANPDHLLLDAVRAQPSREVWDQRDPTSF